MHGLMMDWPLMISSIIRHADRCHGDTEIVSRTVEGPIHRYTYRDAHARARRLANALARLGVRQGDCVATLAWNGFRHFELYYAVSGMGAVIHTINPRLFHDQLVYIVNHAGDRIVFFDLTFLPLVEKLAPSCAAAATWIALTDRAHMPASTTPPTCSATRTCSPPRTMRSSGRSSTRMRRRRCATPRARPAIPRACCSAIARRCCTPWRAACRTRKTIPRRASCCRSCRCSTSTPGASRIRRRWSAPSSCCPARGSTARASTSCSRTSSVETSAGVPTVWLGLINYMKEHKLRFSTFKTTTIGGSACPPAMMKTLRDDFGVRVRHGWGMTEMSPVGTIGTPKSRHRDASPDERMAIALEAGTPALRRRDEDRRCAGRRAAARRHGRGQRDGQGPVGGARLLQERPAEPAFAGRLVPDRRRRHHRPRRLPDRSPIAPRTSSSRAASGSARSSSRTSPSAIRRWSRRR